MKSRWLLFIICLTSSAVSAPALAAATPVPNPWLKAIDNRIAEKDFLGARILVERAVLTHLPLPIWYALRGILFRNPELGGDLVIRGDRFYDNVKRAQVQVDIDNNIAAADQLLLHQKYFEAFNHYQEIARWLKTRFNAPSAAERSNAEQLYPYILQGMGRALFSMQKYKEALEVYGWITPNYPKFRQVLFERMWASFKSGRIDSALGAIASQRSSYFSEYLEPESYLIQIYLYKRLCRTKETDEVLKQISDYKENLANGKYTWIDWASSDFDLRALLYLATSKPFPASPGASASDRQQEQNSLKDLLSRAFEGAKKRLLEQLTMIQAYSNLAVTPGMEGGLQPIEKVPSREALFKSNLEIWPADAKEEWADEVGHHRYIGESLCEEQRH